MAFFVSMWTFKSAVRLLGAVQSFERGKAPFDSGIVTQLIAFAILSGC